MVKTHACATAVLVACGWCAAASSQDLPANFTLGKYIPSDMWLYIHCVQNDERAWLTEEWNQFFTALGNSGIDEDILGWISEKIDETDRAKATETINSLRELIHNVHWGDLAAREYVFAERIDRPFPDYILLARGAKGSGAHNGAALGGILEKLASLGGRVTFKQSVMLGANVWRLQTGAPDGFGLVVTVFQKQDVVGVAMGASVQRKAADQIIARLTGKDSTPSIVDTKRFKDALAGVPRPEDGVSFFDFPQMVEGLRSMLERGLHPHGSGHGEQPHTLLIRKIFQQFDVFDYSIVSVETEGRRELTHSLLRFRSDKRDAPLARAILDRRLFDKFDRFIPAEATGFSVDSFVDLGLLYNATRKFMVENVPEHARILDPFDATLGRLGLDLNEDVFSWLSGEYVSVELPAAMVTAFGGSGDSVLFIRVKDARIAQQKVREFLRWAQGALGKLHQSFSISAVPDLGDGFVRITHPMFAMFLRPVVGVTDEWLIIGTSDRAIRKCLNVASGDAPSVRQNPRYRAEGLVPTGPVRAASFADKSQQGQQMAAALQTAGMVGSMVVGMQVASAPNNSAARQASADVQRLFAILTKLGPVLQHLDFFSSTSAIATVDGDVLRSEYVITYKKQERKPGAPTPLQ